jgi:hypothetical protein
MEAMTAIVETLPAMIIASSATTAITTAMTDAATTGVMTTGTTVVRDNNTVMNEITMMAITIFVVTLTTVTYILTLNRELETVHPMKLVIAWSTIWSTVPRVPSNSPTTYDKPSGLEVLSLKSLTIMTARSIPSYGSNFMRPLADLLWATSTSWPITFLWWSARWGHQWLVSLLENHFDS